MKNSLSPFLKRALLLWMAALLFVQVYPVSFAAGQGPPDSEPGSSASYDSAYLDDIQKMILPNRSKPIEPFHRSKENGPELICLGAPSAVSEQISEDHVFIPCMRERIRKLIPYKTNGTNAKHPAPSF